MDAEWEALSGLPYLQVRLYLVLRWYMSVATGRVGDVRGISLQSLSEELFVEPAPGRSESGSPTKKAVRSALAQLEKHGLARPCGNGEVLVFFLPKAGSALTRQKTKGHKRGTLSGQAMGHGETDAPQGFQDETGQAMGHWVNYTKGHTSEGRVNHPYQQAAAAASGGAVNNLSTEPVLVLPLQASAVAEWIRLHERQRGCRPKVLGSAPQIAAWLAQGLGPQHLTEAYARAVLDRERTQNRGAINLPFLDIFVQRVMAEAKAVCREGSESAAWHVTPEGISRRAAEVGEPPRREGETLEAFRGRVSFAGGVASSSRRAAHG